jgi:DNA-binding MarR family transcriptional regulator
MNDDEKEMETRDSMIELAAALAEMNRRLHWSITRGVDHSNQSETPFRERRGQVRIMHLLAKGESMTMNDLAQKLDVSRPTVTGIVRGLVEQGYVDRTSDDEDWRVVWISITDAGREALTQHWNALLKRMSGWLSELDDDEFQQMVDAIPAFKALSRILDARRSETREAIARNT